MYINIGSDSDEIPQFVDAAGSAEDMIDEFNTEELKQLKKLNKLRISNEELITFDNFLVHYQKEPRDIVIKAFSVLNRGGSGLIDVSEFNKLLNLASLQSTGSSEEESAVLQDKDPVLSQFVEWKMIFKQHTDMSGGLTAKGAKTLLAKLRETEESEIRDNDDGSYYLTGIKINEFESLVQRCPEPFWLQMSLPV